MTSRPPRRGALLTAAATALAVGGALLAPAQAAGATDASRPPAAHPAAGRSYDVTLITGDRVHFTDRPGHTDDVVTVDRPPGASGAVQIQRSGGDTYVLPAEALPLLAADRLDRRLFDITQLVAMGYDDRRSGGIPLIATAPRTRSARPPAAPEGAKKVRTLRSIDATALRTDAGKARAFWRDVTASSSGARTLAASSGIGKLWLDGRVKPVLDESVPQINAPQAWAEGYDGTGVKVAVLDSGIDASHPDLKDRVAAKQSFVPGEDTTDVHGHGTHVASTLAGSGAASGGRYKGVAPGVDLLVGKVLSDSGSGEDSWVIAGMEWAKAQGAAVVSMSLGTREGDDGTGPTAQAVDRLSADGGPLFVTAAGNSYGEGTVGAPGSAAAALTVAAVDKQDRRADFSSMGPLTGSFGLKPDISAPGVDITAASSQQQPDPPGMYESMSGTSMATPHVAGAAAILRQRHPDWDGRRLKSALMSSSKRLADYTPFEQGTGRVDVLAAVDAQLTATGSVPTGVFRWPHTAGETATRTLTYRNDGARDTKLDLSLDSGPDSGGARLSASSVTVPAGGTADVTLTLDPADLAAGAHASGQVLATDAASGAVVAHTGYGLYREDERYDFTVKLAGRDGKPAAGVVMLAAKGDSAIGRYEVDGERTLRLPRGTYAAWSTLDVPGDSADSLGSAFLIDPETVLDEDTTVTLDASRTRRLSVRTPRASEDRQTVLDWERTFGDGTGPSFANWFNNATVLPVAYDSVYVSPTAEVTDGTFHFLTHWRLGQRTLDARARGHDVALLPQPGGTVTDGRARLRAVYAGNGAAADYAGLDAQGKAVVVGRSDTVSPDERAAAARDAGAALLIVANDGRGRLNEVYADGTPLAIASVMAGEGARLIAAARTGRLTLDVTGHRYASYTYDLMRQYAGAVPDRPLGYAPHSRDLARVTNSFHRTLRADGPATGWGARLYHPAWSFAAGFEEYESYPAIRTEYVTPQSAGGDSWYEQHSLARDGQSADVEERGDAATYRAGRHYRAGWFRPVTAPRFGSGYVGTVTDGYGVQVNVPMWSGAQPGHSGSAPNAPYDGSTRITLYDGDTELRGFDSQQGWWDLPAETKPYRVVATATRDPEVWKSSVRTRTEWGFTYHPLTGDASQQDLKLLNPAYDVATDLNGDVRAGRTVRLGFGAATQDWFAGERITATSATLAVSYDDGKTWTAAGLRRTGAGTWKARLRTPRTPGGTVSLKATAKGPDGLSVSQEVIRAFGLT